MLAQVTSAIEEVLKWIGTFIKALTGTPAADSSVGALSELLPLFAIGIAISAVLLGKSSAEDKRCEFGETPYWTIPSQALLGKV